VTGTMRLFRNRGHIVAAISFLVLVAIYGLVRRSSTPDLEFELAQRNRALSWRGNEVTQGICQPYYGSAVTVR
jgi:hypothetical protein